MSTQSPKIALIGGGTGSFTLLQALKKITPHLTAIVNMSDDGGSTGVLRDELGVLPPGDVRQCLVALSGRQEVRNLFSYRFADGRFEGHSLGNIILSGLELQYGSFEKAIKVASKILNITGKVVPASLDKHILVMEDGDETILGENNIGQHPINNADAKIRLQPPANLNPEAGAAIAQADLIIIAPGNIYSSLLPVFAVEGMVDAINGSRAMVVCFTNLVTKPGQTDGWHVVDYIKQYERYLGEGQIDVVFYNNEPISKVLLGKYASEGEFPVSITKARLDEIQAKAIGARLVSPDMAIQDPNDKFIKRTLIRHDINQVTMQLESLLGQNK